MMAGVIATYESKKNKSEKFRPVEKEREEA